MLTNDFFQDDFELSDDMLEDYFKIQTCRICGCTDDDCSQCIEKTGDACYWIEDDLCSACTGELEIQTEN